MAYIYLVVAFVLNSTGNIFLKLGSGSGFLFQYSGIVSTFTNNKYLFLGCFFFVLNIPFYFLALRYLPISTAYPIMVSASFVIINGYAFLFLKEHISTLNVLGYVLILIGIVLVIFNSK